MEKSQVLSKETVEKLGLEKPEINKDKKEVKVWNSYDEYFEDREDERKNRNIFERVKEYISYVYDWKIAHWWHDTKWYFRNIKKFNKLAKEWRPWDHTYQIDLFKFGLTELADYMEKHGHEEEVSRGKKIEAIHKLVAELERDYEDEVWEKYNSGKKFGEDVNKIVEYDDGSVLYDFKDDEEETKRYNEYTEALANERIAHLNTIFRLIAGQDERQLKKEMEERIKKMTKDEKKEYTPDGYYKLHTELFDGSGIEGWWD